MDRYRGPAACLTCPWFSDTYKNCLLDGFDPEIDIPDDCPIRVSLKY